MKKPLLTIGIPAYKVEEFIEETVKSIADSKYADRLEVLIVNDGSPDRTLEKANSLAKKYSCVKVIDKENGGHGSAINASLKNATGKYFRLLDGDDLFDTEEFDKYLERLEAETADIVFTDYVEWFVKSETRRPASFYGHLPEYTTLDLDEVEFPEWGPMLPTSTIKTKLLQDFNLKIDEKCFYVDQEYNLACYISSKTAIYYPSMIYIYRLEREGQSMQKSSLIKNVKSHETVCERLLSEYKKHKNSLSETKRTYLENRVIVPMCNMQYFIAVDWCKSKNDFLSFDHELSKYPEFYNHPGIVGKTVKLHRKTKGFSVKYNSLISNVARRLPIIKKLGKIFTILALCSIPIIIANAIVANHVNTEKTYYYWDTSAYWTDAINVTEMLKTNKSEALEAFNNSMVSDYNMLPNIPLFPILLILGTSRIVYVLAILNLYGIPFAAIMTMVIKKAFFKDRKFHILLYPLLFATFLLSPQILIPVLNGRPDIICLIVAALMLLLIAKRRMQYISDYFILAVLTFILITLRRYFCFFGIGIYGGIFVVKAIQQFKQFKDAKVAIKKIIKLTVKLLISGLTIILLMAIFTPFLLARYVTGQYGDAYSAYQVSLGEHFSSYVEYFGVIILILAVWGLIYGYFRSRKAEVKEFITTSIISTLICFILFIRVQKFGDQHSYMILLCLLIGISALIVQLYENRKTKILAILVACICPLLSLCTFGVIRLPANIMLPRHFYPVVRNDTDTISELDRYFEEHVSKDGSVYVLASSDYFNCALLQNNKLPVIPSYRIVNAHQVDKRDGFPDFFFDSEYIVVATPIQTHLAEGSQDVISFLAQTILDGEAANLKLEKTYQIDDGVSLNVYHKDGKYTEQYLSAIKSHFEAKYKDYPFLYKDIRQKDN